MTRQVIGVGTVPNDNTGDQARTAFTKVNANFKELYLNGAVANILPSGDSTGATDAAAIQSAINTLSAAGGGVINLSAGTYYTNAGLSFPQGAGKTSGIGPVAIIGIQPTFSTVSDALPDIATTTPVGGTIFQAVGSTAWVSCNKTVLGAPASGNAFMRLTIQGVTLKNIAAKGYTRMLDAGNTNNPSFMWSNFDELYACQCTDWGFYVVNQQINNWGKIHSYGAVTGQIYFGQDLPGSIDQQGNSTIRELGSYPLNNLSRGIVFEAANQTACQHDEWQIQRAQSAAFNSVAVSQATTTNGTANITVADGTKFAVRMPVAFTAVSTSGLTVKQIYFVTSVAANVIQIANTMGGTALTPTAGTPTILTQGMALMELVGLGAGVVASSNWSQLDLESGGTCALVMQNTALTNITFSAVPITGTGTAQSVQSIAMRSASNTFIYSPFSIATDADSGTSSTIFYAQREAGSVQNALPMVPYDKGRATFGLDFGGTIANPVHVEYDAGNNFFKTVGVGLSGLNVALGGAAAQTIFSSYAGNIDNYYVTSNTTFTLPTITTALCGTMFYISNNAAAAKDLIINTNGTQVFNGKAATTTITLKPGAGITIGASNSFNGFNWGIYGMAGTYAAGVITGI